MHAHSQPGSLDVCAARLGSMRLAQRGMKAPMYHRIGKNLQQEPTGQYLSCHRCMEKGEHTNHAEK